MWRYIKYEKNIERKLSNIEMIYHARVPMILFMVLFTFMLLQIEIELALLWDRCYKYALGNK